MKKFLLSASILALGIYAFSANAEVTPYMAKSLSSAALNNILNSEKVFCYTVEMATPNYTGYTLDQLALTGYCGQLKEEKSIFVQEFFEKSENISETTASCRIEPKIMFRFIRGVDATDVLISDTCPSITVFYGGSMKAFNAAPIQKSLEGVVSLFAGGRIDFVSPALIDELMPSGVILNDEQRALVNEQKSSQPIRNWQKSGSPAPTPASASSSTTAPKAQEGAKGWNKLKNN